MYDGKEGSKNVDKILDFSSFIFRLPPERRVFPSGLQAGMAEEYRAEVGGNKRMYS